MGKYTINLNDNFVDNSIQTDDGTATFVDVDTLKRDGERLRLANLSGPEVQHIDEGGNIKQGEWGGNQLTDEISRLAQEGNYDTITEQGRGFYGRSLVELQDERGEDIGNRAIYEGIVDPKDFNSTRQQDIADIGAFSRAFNEPKDDMWQASRDRLNENARKYTMSRVDPYTGKRSVAFKDIALNEEQLGRDQAAVGEGTFGRFKDDQVEYRHSGMDITGIANNAFGAGWDRGLNSIESSFYGAASVLGDIVGSDELYKYGQIMSGGAEYGNENLGRIVGSYKDVKDWTGAGKFIAGMAGQSLPYLVGLFGTAGAGAAIGSIGGVAATIAGTTVGLGSPSLIYAGEIYNGMEGTMNERNVAHAIAGGLAAASLDRLGMRGILKPSDLLKSDGIEQVAKAYAKKHDIDIEVARETVQTAFDSGKKELVQAVGAGAKLKIGKGLVAQNFANNFGRGALIEGLTEVGQEGIIYGAQVTGSNKEGDWGEAGDVLVNAAIGGAILGGGISGVGGTTKSIGNFQQHQRDLGISDGDQVGDFYPGTNESNFEEAYLDGIGKYSDKAVADMDNEYVKGREADLFKNKGFFQTAKELPGRYAQKFGSIIEGRWKDKISPEAKKTLFSILDTVAPSNVSHMAGVNMGKMKMMLAGRLKRGGEILMNEAIQLSGLTLDMDLSSKQKAATMAGQKLAKFMKVKEGIKNGTHTWADVDVDMQGNLRQWNAIAKKMNVLTDTLRKVVVNQSQEQIGHQSNYFANAVKLDKEMVRSNKAAFIEMGQKYLKLNPKEALSFYNSIVDAPAGYNSAQLHELGFKNRTISPNLLEKTANLKDYVGIDQFVDPNKFAQLQNFIEQDINFAIDKKILGTNNQHINGALTLLKNQMGDQWDPRIATWVKDSIAAGRNDYRPIQNKALASAQANITFFNTTTQLDTSLFASIPELATIMLGSSGKENGKLIAGAARAVGANFMKKYRKNRAKIVKNSGYSEQDLNDSVEDFYRYAYDHGAQSAVAQVDIDLGEGKGKRFRSKFTSAFFKVNLLAPFTDATRIARLSMANDAIFSDLDIMNTVYFNQKKSGGITNYSADAYGRLRDLNVDPEKMAEDYTAIIHGMPGDVKNKSQEAIYKHIKDNHPEFLDQMDNARKSYVDAALANPNPVDRPLWYSDPHFRLFTQYQGFLSTFTSHILPRVWKNVKSSNPAARYNAIAVASTMLLLGFMGQELKDEFKRDGMTPQGLTQGGFYQRGITASGLVGTGERVLNLAHPLYGRATANPYELALNEAGPTTGTIGKIGSLLEALVNGDDVRAAVYGKKLTPGSGVYDAWKHGLGIK